MKLAGALASVSVVGCACPGEPAADAGRPESAEPETTGSGRGESRERLSGIVQIDAEGSLACALDGEGVIFCWGRFDFSRDAVALERPSSRPVRLGGIRKARSLALHLDMEGNGLWVGFAVEDDGEVMTWGRWVGPVYRVELTGDPPEAILTEDLEPELDPMLAQRRHPDEVRADPEWESSYRSLQRVGRVQERQTRRAVTTRQQTSGSVVSPGICPHGLATLDAQLLVGCAFLEDEPMWRRVQAREDDLPVSGCALTEGGVVQCWGVCEGTLGGPGASIGFAVVLPAATEDLVFAFGEEKCWAARLATGEVATWCQLGSADRIRDTSTGDLCPSWKGPVMEPDLRGVVDFDEGTADESNPTGVCGLRGDGTIVCWRPSLNPHNAVRPLELNRREYVGFDRPTSVAAGQAFLCVMTAGGHVQCVGRNADGECGDGSSLDEDAAPTHLEMPVYVVAPDAEPT